MSSVVKWEWIASMTVEGEDATVASGLVMRCSVVVAVVAGRRPLLIFNPRWEDFGEAS
jgi:hypothetical protein